MSRSISDPAHPDFIHGVAAGAQYGCGRSHPCPATPTCWEQRRKQVKHAQVRRDRGQAVRVPREQALAYVDHLLQVVPGATDRAINKAAGLAVSTIVRMRKGGAGCSVETYSKLRAVTPEALAPFAAQVPVEWAQHLIRMLQASGFPLHWQQKQAGVKYNLAALWTVRHDRDGQRRAFCARGTYDGLKALAERLGQREADPGLDGLTVHQIGMAKSFGRRHGYYPAAAYDEDGKLDLRLLPGHKWAEADDDCGRVLDVLRLSIETDKGPKLIAAQTGQGDRRVLRLRERVGLHYRAFGEAGTHTRLLPECQPAVDRVRLALMEYDDGGDPALLCLRLGAASIGSHQGGVPHDHPAAVAYLAERAEGRCRELVAA